MLRPELADVDTRVLMNLWKHCGQVSRVEISLDKRQSDADIIARSLESPELFALIFDRHFVPIRNYLRRRLDIATADELAAETLVIAFRRRSEYDAGFPSARAWLFGISANLLHRHWRKERRELRAYVRYSNLRLARAEESGSSAVDASIDSDIAEAVRALPRSDREVLFLYACAELSYEEISNALGIPMGTVRSRLSRARRRVREHLGAQRGIKSDVSIDAKGVS